MLWGATSSTWSGGMPRTLSTLRMISALIRSSSLAVGRPRFRHHHQALGSGIRIDCAEGRDAAAPHSGYVSGGRLNFLGNDVAAGFDDAIFDAAGHVQFTVRPNKPGRRNPSSRRRS